MRVKSLRVSEIERFWKRAEWAHNELREDDGQVVDTEDGPSRNTGGFLTVPVVRLILE